MLHRADTTSSEYALTRRKNPFEIFLLTLADILAVDFTDQIGHPSYCCSSGILFA